jgi:hypothetical protein
VCRARVGEERPVDDIGEATLEGSECFGAGVAAGAAPLEIGDGVRMDTRLGDGDPVQCGVELPVPRSREAVANTVA